MTRWQVWFDRWREYSEISEAGKIARRAFANNSFDGVLTMIGVVMGNFVVGVQDGTVVLVTGLSTALAIGISGGWGAYLTESARPTATEHCEPAMTFIRYEVLRALCRAIRRHGLRRGEIHKIFCGNARALVAAARQSSAEVM